MTGLDLWLLLLCTFSLLVALGATSGVLNERLWVSEPLACVLAGIAIGPLGAGLLALNPAANATDAMILREAARVTLAIAVTAAAMHLPAYWLRQNWRGLAVALGPGMLLMWGAGALVGAVTTNLPVLYCLLLAAAVAPTDPVLSAPILSGQLARRAVPAGLRDAMTAESAINDGLGLPLVMLPILLMRHAPSAAGLHWLVHVVGWEIGGGIAAGAAAGWVTGRCMTWARGRPDADGASLLTVTIALALATMAGVHLLGADDILAAFVAGAVLNNVNRQAKVQEHHERFSEAVGRFFDLPVMILFGAAIPWADWIGLGWRGAAFAIGILILRRPPAWLLLGRLMPWTRTPRNAVFAGWFGPIGAAALFYAMLIQDQTGSARLWPFISLAIGASVLAHGVSATPLTRLFGAIREDLPAAAEAPQSVDPGKPGQLTIPLALLAIVPLAPVLAFVAGAPRPYVFLAGAGGVAVLADWVRRGTEQIARRVGPAIGGLLAVSFGSISEIILATFVLASGQAAVVRAQITGSIIGTCLLGLGIAILVGGIGRERQGFKRERAGLLSSLLILTVIALLLPALFNLAHAASAPRRLAVSDEQLSIGVSLVLLALYAANLAYTLVTHRDVFASGEPRDPRGGWPLWVAVLVLVAATAAIALDAELVSGALQATAGALGLSPIFLGVIVLAVVGTASDLVASAWFARQDRMGLVLNICIGSAIQMALVVAPVLVLVSWAIGRPMTLVFDNPLDLFAIAGTAFIVNAIAADGETTWFEGVLLIGIYALFGLAFFFVG